MRVPASSDAALAQDPARQFLQILARAIFGPVQQNVTLVGGQFRIEQFHQVRRH